MASLKVQFADFPQKTHSHLQGEKILQVTELECLHAVMTVGIQTLRTGIANERYAISMALHKFFAIECSLDFSQTEISLQAEYVGLDSSEKRNLSYWVGMTFASILARKYLDVRQLLHAEPLKKSSIIEVSDSNSRSLADLVGKDTSGNWHVVEAKARCNKVYSKDFDKWKLQARTVDKIDGISPITRSYTLVNMKNPLDVKFTDPPEVGNELDRYDISFPRGVENDIIEGYYAPIFRLIDDEGSSTYRGVISGWDVTFSYVGFDLALRRNIYVGMLDFVLSSLRENQIPNLSELEQSLEGVSEERAGENGRQWFIGKDGIVIYSSNTLGGI
jgi:hypothetical protein